MESQHLSKLGQAFATRGARNPAPEPTSAARRTRNSRPRLPPTENAYETMGRNRPCCPAFACGSARATDIVYTYRRLGECVFNTQPPKEAASRMQPAGYDAVIVGAGIVGAACADEFARRGMRVAVLDRDVVGGGATAA